ncbi:MAG: hypothetical protein U1F65_08760 [Verrucomicrobiota bacterium]
MSPAPLKNVRQQRSSRPRLALLLLALFLAVELFAGSGGLHRTIHADASDANHQCFLTLLVDGQVLAALAAVSVTAFAATFLFSLPIPQVAVATLCDLRLAHGRAPPRF